MTTQLVTVADGDLIQVRFDSSAPGRSTPSAACCTRSTGGGTVGAPPSFAPALGRLGAGMEEFEFSDLTPEQWNDRLEWDQGVPEVDESDTQGLRIYHVGPFAFLRRRPVKRHPIGFHQA